MAEKERLLECLQAILEIAQAQENKVTTEEIDSYIEDMGLDDNGKKAVYTYLSENKVYVQGFEYIPPQMDAKEDGEESERKESEYLNMYLEELDMLDKPDETHELLLYRELLEGSDESAEKLVTLGLQQVIVCAEEYKERGIDFEDLILEGNMGLWEGIKQLQGKKEKPEDVCSYCRQYLKESICYYMEALIDSKMEDSDKEQTIIAKTNLLAEAARYLAEENGRTATWEELADYTKMDKKEIEELAGLSKDTEEMFG